MSMRTAAIAWFLMEFFGTFNAASGVASAAHVGGLVFGFVFGWYLTHRDTGGTVQYYNIPIKEYSWQNEA
jgi:membrane associated rhomboid family serine protease